MMRLMGPDDVDLDAWHRQQIGEAQVRVGVWARVEPHGTFLDPIRPDSTTYVTLALAIQSLSLLVLEQQAKLEAFQQILPSASPILNEDVNGDKWIAMPGRLPERLEDWIARQTQQQPERPAGQ